MATSSNRFVQSGAGSLAMPASAELLGEPGDVNPSARTKAHLDAPARLLHEQECYPHAGQAADQVDELLGVVRQSAGPLVVTAMNLRPGNQAVSADLQAVERQTGQSQPAEAVVF